MASPPFRLAGAASARAEAAPPAPGMPSSLLCCGTPAPDSNAAPRRARLADLNPHLHCSVIGTCMGTAELRKLVPRFLDLDRVKSSDLEIHHGAVQLATDGGAGAKALHKALDDRYEAALKRFQRVKGADELRACWEESLNAGEVPGAYWALMSHPQVTGELRQLAFGEVHMLSHLVGAANRADIRRLQALERDNGDLSARVDDLQSRLQEATAQRQLMEQQLAERTAAAGRHAPPEAAAHEARIELLEAELATRDKALAHHTARREAAEGALLAQQASAALLQARIDEVLQLVAAFTAELHAVETTLAARFDTAPEAAGSLALLRNRRLVYVGGRPASNNTIKAIVERAGGELVVHDGGIEDRKGLLAAALPGADMVVFPVDCIDHDSMSTVKRVCERRGIPFHPLRSASAASFSALIERLAAAPHAVDG